MQKPDRELQLGDQEFNDDEGNQTAPEAKYTSMASVGKKKGKEGMVIDTAMDNG